MIRIMERKAIDYEQKPQKSDMLEHEEEEETNLYCFTN